MVSVFAAVASVFTAVVPAFAAVTAVFTVVAAENTVQTAVTDTGATSVKISSHCSKMAFSVLYGLLENRRKYLELGTILLIGKNLEEQDFFFPKIFKNYPKPF